MANHITQDTLYKRLENNEVAKVMWFIDHKPSFKDVSFGSFILAFPLPIPSGPQNKTISYPGPKGNLEKLIAFEKALKYKIATDPAYENYYWETKSINLVKKG